MDFRGKGGQQVLNPGKDRPGGDRAGDRAEIVREIAAAIGRVIAVAIVAVIAPVTVPIKAAPIGPTRRIAAGQYGQPGQADRRRQQPRRGGKPGRRPRRIVGSGRQCCVRTWPRELCQCRRWRRCPRGSWRRRRRQLPRRRWRWRWRWAWRRRRWPALRPGSEARCRPAWPSRQRSRLLPLQLSRQPQGLCRRHRSGGAGVDAGCRDARSRWLSPRLLRKARYQVPAPTATGSPTARRSPRSREHHDDPA